jgi:long-chain acyl-CoA synthetase
MSKAPVIYSGDRQVPLADIRVRAARAAAGLKALGVGHGDTIAVYLRNDFPHLEAAIAAGMVGAYVVPVNWHYSVDEARYIFEDSGAKLVVIHADLLVGVREAVPAGVKVLSVATPPEIAEVFRVDAALAEVAPGDLAWDSWVAGFEPLAEQAVAPPGSMIYTSGTTGRPKGVRRAPPTPEQAAGAAGLSKQIFGIGPWEDRPEDIVLCIPGPLYHSAPNGWAMRFLQIGANMVLQPKFDAEQLLKDIERFRITHLLAVPTMFVRLLKLPDEVRAKYDLSSLQFVMHGAAPCAPHVKRSMIEWWGPIIWEHYGNTEAGALTLCDSAQWLAHPGTVGKVLDDADFHLLDEEGNDVPTGMPGEVVAWRPSYADFTYHGDDDKRRKAEKRPGLIALGDVGFLDPEGFLYLSGRASDMVISGGVNIYPAEIEAELQKMPGVADCAVFGIPDEEFGEQLLAVVQAEPGADLAADAVRAFLRGRLAGFKVPRQVEFSAELPREDSGKIFKRKLRAPYWEAAGRQI